ncbi:MAG TPA: GNAT family N-acetyltransferase [Candidatus Limnocylindrales bacterium]
MPFDPGDGDVMDAAAQLLATRHRSQRLVEPGLDPRYEDPAVTRLEIQALAGRPGASGSVARRGGTVVGYLLGSPRAPMWGPNVWVEGAGHAVDPGDAEILRDLYGQAAAGWVESGATNHYALVPAHDAALLDAWFRVSFGMQHVHGLRDAPGPDETFTPPPGIAIRRAEKRDIPALGRLDLALAEHQVRSPVFARLPPPTLEEATNEWEEGFDDPAYTTFVAEHDGVVVGSAIACAIDVSSEHAGIVRPPNAGFLGFAAVLPEARGLGAGRALGEAVLAWSRDAGHPTVVTDWRETNLLSSRTWPRLGFRPTFRRLFRAIA